MQNFHTTILLGKPAFTIRDQLQWIQQDPSHWHQDGTTHTYSLSNFQKFQCYNNHFYLPPFSGEICCRLPPCHKKFTTSASFKRSLRQDLEIGPSWVWHRLSLSPGSLKNEPRLVGSVDLATFQFRISWYVFLPFLNKEEVWKSQRKHGFPGVCTCLF